jgi:hypothetical protein
MLLLLALPSAALFQLTSRKQYLVIGLFMLGTVLLTASRTGLALSGVSIALLCVASRRWAYVAALAISAVGGYLFLDFVVRDDIVRDWFPYLSEFVVKVHSILNGDQFDLESINSFRARLAIWDRSMDWYHASPLLGSGPLRDVIPSFADNYYIYLLSRYGAVGLALYASFSLYVAGVSIRAVFSGRTPLRQWGTLALVSLVVVNIANYTIDAFLIVPIGSLCLLYTGYLTSLADSASCVPARKRLRLQRRHTVRMLPVRPALSHDAASHAATKRPA